MNTTLADNRKFIAMTEVEADEVFASIAQLETECAAIDAVAEQRIAAIKRDAEDAAAIKRAEIIRKAAELERYITAHRDRFQSPRARKTNWGQYGLRTVTNVQVTNETELMAFATINNRRDLIEVVTKLDKSGVAAAIDKGEALPGAAKVTGERTFYKTAKALLDAAKNNVMITEKATR